MLKFLLRPFLFLYSFLLLWSLPVMAEIDPYENTLMGPFQNGAAFTVKDTKFENSSYNWSEITNFSVKNAVTLRVIDNVLIPYQFNYTVSVKIDYYTAPGSGPISVNKDLTVNYDPVQGARYKATDSYTFEGAYKIVVTVLGVNAHGGTPPSGPVVQLSSNIVINRQSVFKPQSSINPDLVLADHNQVKLNWDFVTGAEEYDIEWTTINGGNENFSTIDEQQKGQFSPDVESYKAVLGQAFRNNASRVTTAKHDYVLSLLSTDTYFLLRIRQAQYTADGVRLTGEWNYINKNGGYTIIPIIWNEPNLNWQYAAAFAEEGKKKEVISYFDGTLRGRQTVTLNNSDSVAMAQETVYDEFGRKAASILPAPFKELAGKSYLHYAPGFNVSSSGSPYSFLNLQGGLAGCEPAPEPLNVSSGASKYYSANNSFLTADDKPFNKFIPDASGFPIELTQYTADNTGRIKLQGGVGLAFQPGQTINGEASKTTKYYYGKPEQWELDQLFGNDVGYAERYLKNMVVDPNGQISISYLNGSGKTIATALTGAPPANLKALPSYNPVGALKRTSLLKPEQFIYNSSEQKLTATTTYLASVTGPGTLTYNIQKLVSRYPGNAFQICSNCYYEMSVKVLNDCNEQVAGTSSPVQIGAMLASCADTARYQDSLVVPFNQIGEYHVTIEFAFNKDVIDQYTDTFITQAQTSGAVENEFDYIKKRYLDSLDVSGCYADCRTCQTLLGTQGDFVQMLKDKFLSMDVDAGSVNGAGFDTWANGLFTTLKAQCTAMQASCNVSPCSAVQLQMQDDVSPGGQFALFDLNGNALEPDINVLTKVSPGNNAPNWRIQFPVLPATDALYISELITLEDGNQTSPYDAGFTIQMLIKYWKTDWGTRFLIYHPEYCKLQFCQTMSAFESWDQNVQDQVNKAADIPSIPGGAGLSYNASNPSDWLIAADPFFQAGAPGYNLQSQFRADLLQYSVRVMGITSSAVQVKGLSEFKNYLLYCAAPGTGTNSASSGGDAWNNCVPNEDCRVPDREWTAYRDGYFELKEKYYTILRNASCGASCPVGQPIAVPLAGECPLPAEFNIRPFSGSTAAACPGSQTFIVSHDEGSLSKAVTVALYYPPGVESSALAQSLQFAAGERQKSFCVPLGFDAATIAVKSVTCATSAPFEPEPTTVGVWAYMSKENDRTVVDDGPQYQAADFIIRIYKGGNASTHPDPIAANAYNYTGDVAYTITQRTFYPGPDNNTSAHFSNESAKNVNARNPNNGYYADGQFDLNWFFTANQSNWLYLTSVPGEPAPVQTPTTGSSTCITPGPNTNYWAESESKGINQVSNGDFSSGNTGFSSNYVYINPDGSYADPNATFPRGFYHFTTNPQLVGSSYYSFGDHTTGSGQMLYLDGSGDPATSLWSNTKTVETNKTYVFSVWASTATNNAANLQFKINGAQVGNTLQLTETPGWQNFLVQWDSGSNTSAVLNIYDLNTSPGGNDFVLDDIVFAPVCTAAPTSASCISPASSTNYWAESASKGINQATNGDFSSGNTGFSSTYTYINPDGSYSNPNATSAGGFYHFTTNPQLVNPNYYSFGDHTSGSGQMMYLDGGADPSAPVWGKNTAVEPNRTYAFSVWASTSTNNAANLQFKINGVLVGSLQLTETPGWQNFLVQWNSGSNTSATLSIHDLNTSPGGNDFALDDIVFTPICTSAGCPEAYAYKQSRFPSIAVTPLTVTTSAQGNQLLADTQASILAMASAQFKAQSVTWMARLTPGLDRLGADPLTRETLRANLVAICLTGGDLLHPYGASTLPGGATAGNGYSSFGDAIKGVLGLSTFTSDLNPWLIDSPYPYLPLQQSVEKTIESTSNEICSLISALSAGAQSRNMDLYSFLVATYHEAMTLSPSEVTSLQKSCTNCRFILPQEIALPVFLEPGTKGCINASEYNAAQNDLNSAFDGNLTSSDANYENIFSNFMNHRWGFSLTYDDYKQFEAGISGNPVASLCNVRPYSSTNGDPYACIKSAMEVALANGEKDYSNYITEQKAAFRENYISTCSLAQANAGLSANQQIYHYTLYYYDQADNLVRTVPPEGVNLLSDNELAGAANYRKNADSVPDCQAAYNWPALDNSLITDASAVLGAKINAAGNMAVEMWLYKGESSSAQVLLTPVNRNYMFHTSILGKYLTVETYTFDPNSEPNELKMVLSNRVAADISALLPLRPWTHIVVQGASFASSNSLSLYLNGTPLTLLSNSSAAEVTGWEISAGSNPVRAADNYSSLKHFRIYNRLMDYGSEIVANANNTCFLPARTDGMDWYRFNIPPAGSVTTIASNSTVEYNDGFSPVYPTHSLLTNYAYNSTNQVLQQTSPDGGTNRFWYDYISRPIISQNDKQLANNDYSYTAYDALGRITEVGQKNQTSISLGEPGYRYEDGLNPSFLSSGINSQITQTVYDEQPLSAGGISSGLVQENLRKRVAASLYRETQGGDVLRASYYNYDLDGNVKTLTQQVDGIGLKQLDYEYDLISGKVNFVRYQHGQPDQFYYKYSYDAENRLTDAWSGTAAMVDVFRGSSLLPHNQKLDAHYDYYLHGPLARMELGDVYGKVQGTDYAYTLQGWLKGMNSNAEEPGGDMGTDGFEGIHSTIARDIHGMSLFYYGSSDYGNISGTNPFLQLTDYISSGNGAEEFTPLYNGNIAASSNQLSKFNDRIFKVYKYDQLNRISNANSFMSNLPYNLNHYTIFDESFSYDGNGNILTAVRNSDGPREMDDLSYAYNRDGNGKLLNNKLRHVKDGVIYWAQPEDIDDQPDDNYSYDAIGNLTHDTQEGIDNIDWTVYGKIRGISRSDGTQISYTYDPSGNRVSKTVNGMTTWYIRDAQGNTMGLYDNRSGGMNWREQHLYGSSRLGLWNPGIELNSASGTAAWDTTGKKSYELVNHLGNVMATLSDKRLQHTSDGSAIDYFEGDVLSQQEYYAFGSPMRRRTYSSGSSSYRYGFNGKENDNEVKKDGDGNPNIGTQQDYGMRIYDPRSGRFLSVDPLGPQYPWYTPYSFAGNTPVWAADLDGAEPIIKTKVEFSKPATLNNVDQSYILGYMLLNWKAAARNLTRNIEANFRAGDSELINRNEISVQVTPEGVPYLYQEPIVESRTSSAVSLILDALGTVPNIQKGGLSTGILLAEAETPAKATLATEIRELIKIAPKLNSTNKSILKQFAGKSGVYVHEFNSGTVYVGQAKNLAQRSVNSLKELVTLGKKATALKASDAYSGVTRFIPLENSGAKTLNELESKVIKEYGGTMKQGGSTYNIRRVSGQ